jgi:alkylated DNA repair dioxygenase AlkB
VAELRVIHAWLDDPDLLSAVRTTFNYEPGELRATGYLKDEYGDWTRTLTDLGPTLVGLLRDDLGVTYPIVAFQAYREGAGTEWHTDSPFDEQAVLSLGVTRTFAVRRVDGTDEQRIPVHHGDLVVMPSGFQDEWQHRVVPDETIGERISLVFRTPKR